jgi:hypothetical protein
VLREIGLPERGLLLSLVSFNVGVELGQLAVVAAVLPLLAAIARTLPLPRAIEAALVGAVALAVFLLFRAFGVDPAPLAVVTFAGAPLLYLGGLRFGYDRAVRLCGSSVVALLATFWFVERVLGRSWLGGHLG